MAPRVCAHLPFSFLLLLEAASLQILKKVQRRIGGFLISADARTAIAQAIATAHSHWIPKCPALKRVVLPLFSIGKQLIMFVVVINFL
jgi:hypothetical protein